VEGGGYGDGGLALQSPPLESHASRSSKHLIRARDRFSGLISPGVSVPIAVPGRHAPDMGAQYWSPKLQ
jgi:hypothetical protein